MGKTYNTIVNGYYDLFKRVKAGKTTVQISEKTKRTLLDCLKVAITYSISENKESSNEIQEKMKETLLDYNEAT